jgi:threonine aldolase
MKIIDLRSDTVTQPTAEMREAMAEAPVGDDVYGEDPTVNALQELAASMLGKEAALFVPSGTMGNLSAILAQCARGEEVIVGNVAHTFLMEAGGMAALGGIHPLPLENQADGTLRLDDILEAIRPDDPHYAVTRMICLENTHNRCRGAALSVDYGHQVRTLADEHDLLMHLDGARLFNAAASLGVDARELVEPFDTVTFCLSKGLSAPVGSMICGPADTLQKVYRARKILGGAMRQVGILAAAGIVALNTMVERLPEDHARAKRLAGLASAVPGLVLEAAPTSNMVYITLEDNVPHSGEQFRNGLRDAGLLIGKVSDRRFRMVTHAWVDDSDIESAANILSETLISAPASA